MVPPTHRIPVKMQGAVRSHLDRRCPDLIAKGSGGDDDGRPARFGTRRGAYVESHQKHRNGKADQFSHQRSVVLDFRNIGLETIMTVVPVCAMRMRTSVITLASCQLIAGPKEPE
jgi:hypothetical protein